jgi:hypothetical protein
MSLSRLILYFGLLVVFGCICFGKWAPGSAGPAEPDLFISSPSIYGFYAMSTTHIRPSWFHTHAFRYPRYHWHGAHRH